MIWRLWQSGIDLRDLGAELEAYGEETARLAEAVARVRPEARDTLLGLQASWTRVRMRLDSGENAGWLLTDHLEQERQVMEPLLADLSARRQLPNLVVGPDLRVREHTEDLALVPSAGRHYRSVVGVCTGSFPALLFPEPRGGVLVWLPPGGGRLDCERLEALARASYTRAARPALERALLDLRRALGAQAVELFMLQHERLLQTFLHADRPEPFRQRLEFRLGEGLPGRVAESNEPLCAADLAAEARFLRSQVVEDGFQAYVCVPILHGERVAGTLGVAWRRSNPPTEDAVRLLRWAASPLLVAARPLMAA